jgi:hypothetical protein
LKQRRRLLPLLLQRTELAVHGLGVHGHDPFARYLNWLPPSQTT